jgi:thiol-disulfide isomerase/thioredoxin
MRRRDLALAAAGGTLAAALVARQGGAQPTGPIGKLVEVPPRPLPEFGFTDAEGRPRTVADFAGRGLVINLWATWCPPCVAEMPALDRTQAALAGDGIRVLALSSDRGGRAMVEPFYQRVGIRHLEIWLDPRGAAQRALGARGLPTTILVDRAGQERARLEGATEWDEPPMLAAIRRLVTPVRPTEERA